MFKQALAKPVTKSIRWSYESDRLSDYRQPPEIRVQNLSLFYQRQPVFRPIKLTLKAGAINAIIGPSGCGKTSFLNCLNRLTELEEQAQVTGKILLGDTDIMSLPVWQLRRKIGLVFQQPSPFPLSIYRNLAFPLKEHGMKSKAQRDRVIEQSLRDVGLWDEVKDRLQTSALALSGGQQQRLCLARAIALKPEVLLMDEPCSALDPLSSEVIESLILQLKGLYTIVIVTHNLAQASRISDQVAVFWQNQGIGELIEVGPTKRVFSSPQHPSTQAYVTGKQG
ncbi:MAG: phosphate ABC transporter ATP-binding protein [Cyanobacteria bacterium P01_F01_bin.42]